MKILKVEELNEKLNIQPVSKDRLLNAKQNQYETIALNGLLWRTENETTLVGTDGKPLNEEVFDKNKREFLDYGDYVIQYDYDNTIYYTFSGALKIVPNGWRLPTIEDCESIVKYGKHLISKEYKCSDKYGFNAKLLGFSRRPFVSGFNSFASFWCVDTKNPQKPMCFIISKKDKPYCEIKKANAEGLAMSVRLCKDL